MPVTYSPFSSSGIMARCSSRTSRPPRFLRFVRAQLLDALEIARLDASDVLAVEARRIERIDAMFRAGHGLLQVGKILVDQPVHAEQLLDFLVGAVVGDQFLRG